MRAAETRRGGHYCAVERGALELQVEEIAPVQEKPVNNAVAEMVTFLRGNSLAAISSFFGLGVKEFEERYQ